MLLWVLKQPNSMELNPWEAESTLTFYGTSWFITMETKARHWSSLRQYLTSTVSHFRGSVVLEHSRTGQMKRVVSQRGAVSHLVEAYDRCEHLAERKW